MKRSPSILLILLLAALLSSTSSGQTGPKNLDFENELLGLPGEGGWFSPPAAVMKSYKVELSKHKPHSGKQCVEVASVEEDPERFGNVMQSFDAVPFRGKRVTFKAFVRVESEAFGRGQLWLRVDRANKQMGFFDNMGDRPITSGEWKEYTISGVIHDDALAINIGCMLIGEGKVYFDDVTFTAEAKSTVQYEYERPRALTEQGLQNLIAFGKLYGYLRYFHPSDQAEKAQWDNIAINGVRFVEDAKNPEELAARLTKFFSPIAPTVRIFPSTNAPEVAANIPPEATHVTIWKHRGVGFGSPQSIYSSKRATYNLFAFAENTLSGVSGGIHQTIPASHLSNKQIKLTADIWCKTEQQNDKVWLWVKPFKAGDKNAKAIIKHVSLVSDWKVSELAADIPADVDSLTIGCSYIGNGSVLCDNMRLSVNAEPDPLVRNPSFEQGFQGWDGSETDLYTENIGSRGTAGGWCATITGDADAAAELSSIYSSGKTVKKDLGGGVSAILPIMLYSNSNGTFPQSQATSYNDDLPEGYSPNGGDRATRLADVIIAWNVFQHFYPYFDVVKTDWHKALTQALTDAGPAKDEGAFDLVLKAMISQLHDGHGTVWHPELASGVRFAPFNTYVDGNTVVITEVADVAKAEVHSGDIIEKINDEAVGAYLDRRRKLISTSTVQHKESRLQPNILGLYKDESVKLQLRSADGSQRTINMKTVAEFPELEPKLPANVAELEPGIFYVNLDKIKSKEFTAAYDKLAEAKAIIFDMRGYPADNLTQAITHIIDKPVSSARWNVPTPVYPDMQNVRWAFSNWDVQPAQPRFTKNIVHLTDGRAVSAAETYMGIIEHYKIGEIVGSPTAGTNGNINPFTLPGGYRVSWTGMRVLKHDGSQHHGIGILPTVPCKPTVEGIRAGRDEVLEKGIEVAKRMIKEN